MFNLLTLVWIEEQVESLFELIGQSDTHAQQINIMILTQELELLSETQLQEWLLMELKQEIKPTEEDLTIT